VNEIAAMLAMKLHELPYVVTPAVKGPGTEFCNGFWNNQSDAQFGGTVIQSAADSHHLLMTAVSQS
jgi:hypothetical protein